MSRSEEQEPQSKGERAAVSDMKNLCSVLLQNYSEAAPEQGIEATSCSRFLDRTAASVTV